MKDKPEREVSVLEADLLVEGSVSAELDMVIKGHVRGDVVCKGGVEVCGGCVEGNLTARSIRLLHADIAGTVRAETKLTVTDSKVNGDLFACDAEVEGTIFGNITTDGMLVVRQSAVIQGDIAAGNVSIEKDVALEGKISIRKLQTAIPAALVEEG